MMVDVSAVITAHNEEKYIAGCIESILGQTARPKDIVVVDDGSRDRTAEIALSYPAHVYRVEYGSTYFSKRAGLFLARNDIVLSVDGDTFLAPDFVERGLMHILEEGYAAATGWVLPHNDALSGRLAASIANSLPTGIYYSGPGYIVDRRIYFDVCRVEKLAGDVYVDLCMEKKEIPLELMSIAKDPEMVMWTELPSTGQKRIVKGAGAGATAALIIAALSKI